MVAPLALMGASLATNVIGGAIRSLTGSGSGTQATGHQPASKLKKAATDFESVFLEQAFGHLTENTGSDGPLGDNGTGGSIYKSMLMKEYAGAVVKSGGVGLADSVYRQMLKLQEGAGAAQA